MKELGTLKGLTGFVFGSTFGFIVGMLLMMTSMKAEAYDANGEAFCLAKNIYFEAGNQPLIGKVAVSHVVLNRVDSSLYPDTICDVVYQSRWRINWKGEEVQSETSVSSVGSVMVSQTNQSIVKHGLNQC